MKREYPYLKDTAYMYLADTQKLQNQFVKLTLLDWKENPLQEIQGIATGGTISLNGNSAIRRTCSLNMTVQDISTGKITDTRNLISMNKKVYVEIGITNTTNKYTEYPILWYPQGTFVFTQCSVTTGVSQGTSLSAQLKDKMCLLNGECGGTITSSVIFDRYDTIDEKTGNVITTQPVISMIIKELVNHLGGEDLTNIVINDIPDKIKMVVRWLGDNPIYLVSKGSEHFLTTSFSRAKEKEGVIQMFNYGQDIGFTYEDFVWANGDLSANAGDSVCTILDKIKNYLGNFEYYYDIDGHFIFKEIRNYLNTTQATVELDNMTNDDYVIDIAQGKSIYDFSDSKLITSFSHNPQYSKIKNDYVVWGIREHASGLKLPIRYHLAIDTKPEIGKIYDVFFYNDPNDGLRKAKSPLKYQNRALFPDIGAEEVFYLDESTNAIYRWDGERQKYVSIDGYVYEEYSSAAAFPQWTSASQQTPYPQAGVIYVDLSTSNKYIWTLNPGSTHYNQVASEIRTAENNYQAAIIEQEDHIKIQQDIIADEERKIDILNEDYHLFLLQINSYNTKINNCNETFNSYQAELENENNEKNKQAQNVADLDKLITTLETQKTQTTDETKLAELNSEEVLAQAKKDSATAAMTAAIDEYNRLQNELNSLHLQEQIAEYQAQQNAIKQQHLQEYNERVAICEAKIASANLAIEQAQAIIQNRQSALTETKKQLAEKQKEYVRYIEEPMVHVQATDWRSDLYLSGAVAQPLGLETNYYYTELEAEWPKLYNLQADYYTDSNGQVIYTGAFYDDILNNPWDVDYWLDFIDSEAAISEFSVNNIGRRSLAKSSNDFNCVFESEVPDIVIIPEGEYAEAQREECEARNQDYCQVDMSLANAIGIGGIQNSCFNEIKNLLWEYTKYNSSITISLVPVYHLEPNTRITVNSNDADIHGDFMIDSMSLPLTIGGTMSISASQVQTKL